MDVRFVRKSTGSNALHQAAINGRTEMVKFLLEKGLDIHSRLLDGKTALHAACMIEDYKDTVKLLLEKGIDPTIKNKEGKTALMLAIEKGLQENIKVLKDAGIKE